MSVQLRDRAWRRLAYFRNRSAARLSVAGSFDGLAFEELLEAACLVKWTKPLMQSAPSSWWRRKEERLQEILARMNKEL